jgi:hypothetical protein
MSRPRPIHHLHREIRSTPDEAEPSFSYEQESFLAAREEDVEDEFHRRLAQQGTSRRESSGSQGAGGGSFWRSASENASGVPQGPSFSSVNLAAHANAGTGSNTNNNSNNNNSNNNTNNNNTNNSNNNNSSSNNNNHKGEPITVKERKTSGLLGAALQSQGLSQGTLHEAVSECDR